MSNKNVGTFLKYCIVCNIFINRHQIIKMYESGYFAKRATSSRRPSSKGHDIVAAVTMCTKIM